MDHSVELPEVRSRAGKPPTAVLRIAAVHLGDKVRIEVFDDGQGIDRQVVMQKAVEKGVITLDEAAYLSEQDPLELIFRPGFSTKEQATDLSGRGVGMDVVKETTDRLRGRLTVESTPGRGTRVAMDFPLTLAVLPALYLRIRQNVYALPISAIDSLIDLEERRIHQQAARMMRGNAHGSDFLARSEENWRGDITAEEASGLRILHQLRETVARLQEGIAEQEYVVTNGRIEAALSEDSGAPLMPRGRRLRHVGAEQRGTGETLPGSRVGQRPGV